MTNTTPLATRLTKTLALAARPGTDQEGQTAAYLAGQMAHSHGVTTDQVWQHCGAALGQAGWCYFIDGWYDAAEQPAR